MGKFEGDDDDEVDDEDMMGVEGKKKKENDEKIKNEKMKRVKRKIKFEYKIFFSCARIFTFAQFTPLLTPISAAFCSS